MQRFTSKEERTEYYEGKLMQNVSSISKAFAKFLPKWNQVEIKLFFCLLENINWRVPNNSNIVCLRNSDLIERLDWKPNSKCKSFYKYVVQTLRHMSNTSEVFLQDLDEKKSYMWGKLFYHVEGDEDETVVVFNKHFMPYFEDLLQTKNYYIYWLSDIYSFKSRHAQYLYLDLIAKSKKYGNDYDIVDYSIKQLKEVFGLSKDDYMDSVSGHFNRVMFEKRTLEKAIEEINRSGLIKIVHHPNNDKDGLFGKTYKKNGKVDKYYLMYKIDSQLLNEAKEGKWWYDTEAFKELRKRNKEAIDKFELNSEE